MALSSRRRPGGYCRKFDHLYEASFEVIQLATNRRYLARISPFQRVELSEPLLLQLTCGCPREAQGQEHEAVPGHQDVRGSVRRKVALA